MPRGVWDRSKTKAQRQAEKEKRYTDSSTGSGKAEGSLGLKDALTADLRVLAGHLVGEAKAEHMLDLATTNLNNTFSLLHSVVTSGVSFGDLQPMLVQEAKTAMEIYSKAREKAFAPLQAAPIKEELPMMPGIGAPYIEQEPIQFNPLAVEKAFKEHKS